ncbi:hypothetical protein ES319_A08G040200v1 [Gossypium barbadense]|uniref:Uncharacterized protein n=1 Tax=Gossypium barbadense TaxID=3634 RepID=A0A5J5UKU6_GOSBA|nr:hypothetical protein ES319_A08G040200v1 [Gossypium barbadense]
MQLQDSAECQSRFRYCHQGCSSAPKEEGCDEEETAPEIWLLHRVSCSSFLSSLLVLLVAYDIFMSFGNISLLVLLLY